MASEREHIVGNDYDTIPVRKPEDRDLLCKSFTYNNSAFSDNVISTPPNKPPDSADLAKYKKFAIASLAMSSFALAVVVVLLPINLSTGDMGHTGNDADTATNGDARALGQRNGGGAQEEVKGEAEQQGASGDLALVGLKGERGLVGVKGTKGDAGIPGLLGPRGPKGDRGLDGLYGLHGQKGDMGRQGFPGLDGLPGQKGMTGSQGYAGLGGPHGPPGFKGDHGLPGLPGMKGDRGAKGNKGASCASDFRRIRLVGGSSNSGRIEVFIDGRWGTVCDDSFGENDVSVACRELGFNGGSVLDASSVPDGSLPTALDDLACSGTESSLQECAHIGAWNHDCGHSEDVGLTCT